MQVELETCVLTVAEDLGALFEQTPAWRRCAVFHGRAVAARLRDGSAVFAKGVGWTWGPSGARLLRSRKEPNVVLGLYGEREAIRERAASEALLAAGLSSSRVLGHGAVTHIVGDPDGRGVELATQVLGSPPVVVFTQLDSLLRVADLSLLDAAERTAHLEALTALDRLPKPWTTGFASRLADQVARLHRLGGVNDSLEWSNVTAAGQVTDFEWITVPGVPLSWPDGSHIDDGARLEERQWKEIIYGVEVAYRFGWLVGGDPGGREAAAHFSQAYLDYGGPATEAVDELRTPITLKPWTA